MLHQHQYCSFGINHYLHQYCHFGINALSTPVLSFRHQCIIYTSTVISAAMLYLHQYCSFGINRYLHQYSRFGINALSTSLLSFQHHCISDICTVVSASRHYLYQYCRFGIKALYALVPMHWYQTVCLQVKFKFQYVIALVVIGIIIVFYKICNVDHYFAAKLNIPILQPSNITARSYQGSRILVTITM